MDIVFGKATRIVVVVVSGLIEIANLFMGNIIVYETTEKISFDWLRLLENPLFWIVLIANVIYHSIPQIMKQKAHEVDEEVERAISENSVKILNLVGNNVEAGDFESVNRSLKVLSKLQKRRQK